MVSKILAMTSSPIVFTIIRLILGILFIWAATPKIANPQAFAEIIGNYQILPFALVNPAAIVLPWIEALCGVSLLTNRLIRGSALIFVALMLIFLLATVFNMVRGLDITCGCFSVSADKASGSQSVNLLRNVLLLILGIFVLIRAGAAGKPGLQEKILRD